MDSDFYTNNGKKNPNDSDFRYSYEPNQIFSFDGNNMKINKITSMNTIPHPLSISDQGFHPFRKENSKIYDQNCPQSAKIIFNHTIGGPHVE